MEPLLPPGLKYVTLATDASTGGTSSGFAFYLRSDYGTVKRAWFDEIPRHPTDNEYEALLGGLAEARKHIKGTTKLIVYCDNKICLKMIDDSFLPKTRKSYADQIAKIQELIKDFALVETRHVKAHTQNTYAKKFYMNRWCDINARRQRKYLGTRPIREQLYGQAGRREAIKTRGVENGS